MQCYICGASGDSKRLFDVIYKGGIRKICKTCIFQENLYPLKKSGNLQKFDEFEKKASVKERLAAMTGYDLNKKKDKKSEELKKQEAELQNMVNKNISKAQVFTKPGDGTNLVRNFHWVIMRERRNRKLTQKQLAQGIAEPEMVIRKLERGEVPRERDKLIRKLENYLGVVLTKKDIYEPSKDLNSLKSISKEESPRGKELSQIYKEESEPLEDFDPVTARTLTIGDLREKKKKLSERLFGKQKKSGEETENSQNSKDSINQ